MVPSSVHNLHNPTPALMNSLNSCFLLHVINYCRTGNFRDFRPQAVRMQDIFANLGVEDLPSFNIHEQEMFLHAKICCSTVIPAWIPLLFSYLLLLIALSVCLISMSVTNHPCHPKTGLKSLVVITPPTVHWEKSGAKMAPSWSRFWNFLLVHLPGPLLCLRFLGPGMQHLRIILCPCLPYFLLLSHQLR